MTVGCGVWRTWAEEVERNVASWKLGYRGRSKVVRLWTS